MNEDLTEENEDLTEENEDLTEENEFCPCGDLPADQCDGEMCEDLEDILFGEETFISVLPSDLTGIDLDTFDGNCTMCGSEDTYEFQDPFFDIGYSICKSCGATFHAEITTSQYAQENGIKLPEGFEEY